MTVYSTHYAHNFEIAMAAILIILHTSNSHLLIPINMNNINVLLELPH